jgi:hypothetical protein
MRFFNGSPTNVEAHFKSEPGGGVKPILAYGFDSTRLCRRKLILTIDADWLGMKKMKTEQLILALIAVTFALAPQSPQTACAQADKERYRAHLISPRPGQVLVPGQVVRVAWTADFPDVDLTMCETEVLLSLDGGRTIYMLLTEQRDPKARYFDWTVPNAPTNAAVLDIRFGCLNLYPETRSVQIQSAFVISPVVN